MVNNNTYAAMQIMVTWFFRIPYRYLGAALGAHGPEIRALTARSSFPWYASLEIFGQQRHLGRSRWWKTSSKWRKIGTPHITLMGWSNGTYMHQLAKNLLAYIISICMHIYIPRIMKHGCVSNHLVGLVARGLSFQSKTPNARGHAVGSPPAW